MVFYNLSSMMGHDSVNNASRQSSWRLGVVSFLNARPLICGLEKEPAIKLCFDVPSRLSARLLSGDVDAALIPTIDLQRSAVGLRVISDACIASNGETLTVRVFSRVPPEEIRRVHLDTDSHTSVVLVRLIWPRLFGGTVAFEDLPPDLAPTDCESVLLIGDKVVAVDGQAFRYQIDLGGAWRTWTGLPFVFAVWAGTQGRDYSSLCQILAKARDRGLKRTGQIAVEFGPAHGWPVALAQQYLQRYLSYELTDKHVEGMMRFLDLARPFRGANALTRKLQATS